MFYNFNRNPAQGNHDVALLFWDMILLCSLGWSLTHHDLPTSDSGVLGWLVWVTRPDSPTWKTKIKHTKLKPIAWCLLPYVYTHVTIPRSGYFIFPLVPFRACMPINFITKVQLSLFWTLSKWNHATCSLCLLLRPLWGCGVNGFFLSVFCNTPLYEYTSNYPHYGWHSVSQFWLLGVICFESLAHPFGEY